jgi:hypothetical protein
MVDMWLIWIWANARSSQMVSANLSLWLEAANVHVYGLVVLAEPVMSMTYVPPVVDVFENVSFMLLRLAKVRFGMRPAKPLETVLMVVPTLVKLPVIRLPE